MMSASRSGEIGEYFWRTARSASLCGWWKLLDSAWSPGRSSLLGYVATPASNTRQYTFDHPASLQASSMWRTPSRPHLGPFALSIQSECVSGAESVSLEPSPAGAATAQADGRTNAAVEAATDL